MTPQIGPTPTHSHERRLPDMSTAEHWMVDAERVYSGRFLIGEDEDGDLCAPTRQRFSDGQRVWKRTRWPWLRLFSSRLQRKVVWLEKPPLGVS